MAPRFALFPVPAYKVSKAALNMLTVQYAQSFADQGFTFLAISPGVRYLSPCLKTIMELTSSKVGEDRPWWREGGYNS